MEAMPCACSVMSAMGKPSYSTRSLPRCRSRRQAGRQEEEEEETEATGRAGHKGVRALRPAVHVRAPS